MDTVPVEVSLKPGSPISRQNLIILVENYLRDQNNVLYPNTIISIDNKGEEDNDLYSAVSSITIGNLCNESFDTYQINFKDVKIDWYFYKLCTYSSTAATVTNNDTNEEIDLATYLTLPSLELHTLWENLHYSDNIKENLLKYAKTMMKFAEKAINPNIISCNRIILLHGPPGTGKTSLCKALAQKLSIRMNNVFPSTIFIEINSHSLFSKWYSESCKLVNNIFKRIKEAYENPKILVCVLIDEIETLALARNRCITGNEPTDSVRVVNTLLTQIDHIRRFPNVLIFTTSNMTQAIDCAFIDRADIKQYLGAPTITAIYKIYHSCIKELLQKELIISNSELIKNVVLPEHEHHLADSEYRNALLTLCEASVGLSGRTLRKIPFLAHALYSSNNQFSIPEFLHAMSCAIEKERQNKENFITDFDK